MDKTDLILTGQTSKLKKITTTITYVNPNVESAKLKALAQKLNSLTTNSLDKIAKETESVL